MFALFFLLGTKSRTWCWGGRYSSWELTMRNKTYAAFLLILASSAFAAESSSQAFLKKAIQGNYAEAKMGQLAQQNGQSDDVKNFGRMLADDHSAANQRAL